MHHHRFLHYLLLVLSIASSSLIWAQQLKVGTGIADITGPIVDILFMGYGETTQTGKGLLQRIFARAYVVVSGDRRVVFVNTDTQSMGDIVKKRVLRKLRAKYGDLYTDENVMISAAHSHSSMGGYLQYELYGLPVLGWIEETTSPMVDGIVNAIEYAHRSITSGSITVSRGELLDTNISRSPQSYVLNPREERAQYAYNVDKDMTVLEFRDQNNTGLGLISWFPVHGVSINSTNRLVNGDNKGYAAYITEKYYNPGRLSGKGPFVAAFAQANEGDASPNTLGSYCAYGNNIKDTDKPCDGTYETKCPGSSICRGRGPGWKISDLESNRIIGQNQANKAISLFDAISSDLMSLTGPVDYRQKYWDITSEVVRRSDGTRASLCKPALGYAFGAGTTDGPGLAGFYQNTTHGSFFWDVISGIIQIPNHEQVKCHEPKPILIDTGDIKTPHEWQPTVLDVQLLRIGNLYIAGVPSEMTTMSGRRLRNSIKNTLIKYGLGNNDTIVIQTGPANGYASYCTTYEEYQMQRYEGASTPYGPYTLDAYLQVFDELAAAMATGKPVRSSARIPDYTREATNLSPPHGPDSAPLGGNFGDCTEDVKAVYSRATKPVVSATFVAGNPRNNVMLDRTFLTVEKKQPNGIAWKVVKTDNDYDTRFHWSYVSKLFGISKAKIEWYLDTDTEEGTYRIGYFGHHMIDHSRKIMPHQGYSSEFRVTR